MYKVYINDTVFEYLSLYIIKYREYYEELYKDSWVWSELQIIDWYINESKQRKTEIIELLKNNFSENIIFWRQNNNEVILKWRTKYLFLKWNENITKKERYISYIEIR